MEILAIKHCLTMATELDLDWISRRVEAMEWRIGGTMSDASIQSRECREWDTGGRGRLFLWHIELAGMHSGGKEQWTRWR